MPFIEVKVNCHISDEQECELKSRMGKAIESISGLPINMEGLYYRTKTSSAYNVKAEVLGR
ncbi:MAG: hypothetical protein IJH38_01700 [Clostridia bacterium]|nr:hypothetical protein [Clostridia bacterium]